MAKIVTVTLLLDVFSDGEAVDMVSAMCGVRQLKGLMVDYQVQTVDEVAPELADSIVNETYVAGEFAANWVFFSPSEAATEPDDPLHGYWSNEYGWTSRDLASRFEPVLFCNRPMSRGDDVVFLRLEE